MNPVIRNLVVCENVRNDPTNPLRISIDGLISRITSEPPGSFPLFHQEITVFVQMTGCRGTGFGRIEIVQADTNLVIFKTKSHELQLPNDPLEIVGRVFRLRQFIFPAPGLY